MNEENQPKTGGSKVGKIILALVAVFFIFSIVTVIGAVNPSIKPIAGLIAALISVFVFRRIIRS